jgi:serine/threonine-protein kinase
MIPAGMKAAIMRALSKTPQDRQPNVTAFFEDLTTVDAPVALAATALAAAPGTGTAAMAAPPAELLRGAGGPAPRPRPTANEMVVPVQQAYAAPPRPVPPPKAPGAGGKLLVAGLAGLVGLAGIVAVVLVARGMSSRTGDGDGLELGSALPTPAGVAEISPLASSETANPAPSVSATDASTAPATTNPPSISTRPPTAATKPPPTAKGPQGQEACEKSTQLARQGAIEAAVSLYHACQKGGQTAAVAKAAIRSNAKQAAQQARFRGDCPRAKSIAAAAGSIGADGGAGAEAAMCK